MLDFYKEIDHVRSKKMLKLKEVESKRKNDRLRASQGESIFKIKEGSSKIMESPSSKLFSIHRRLISSKKSCSKEEFRTKYSLCGGTY